MPPEQCESQERADFPPGLEAPNRAQQIAETALAANDFADRKTQEGLLQARAWVEVDLEAIAHNVTQLRNLLQPGTALMAVVKADAYGHGAVVVAQTALQAGASWLGVATVTEGIELRQAGITAPILLLGAVQSAVEVQALMRWEVQPTLSSPAQVDMLASTLAKLRPSGPDLEPFPVHLKLDTGMGRLGVPWQQAGDFVAQVEAIPQVKIASVYSHLATADDPDPTVMEVQHENYEAAIANLRKRGFIPPRLHLANSAATLLQDNSLQYDMVRAGLAVYGLYPAPHLKGKAELQPALQVKARVTQVKQIAAGSGVSYGHRFIAEQDMTVAVVGIGYADGVPRNLSTQLQVMYQGQRLPQLGSITMDQIMLDVSTVVGAKPGTKPGIAPGDVVTLLGKSEGAFGTEQITADDWAEMLGTISWEVLCGFKHRLPRVNLPRKAHSEGN